jgi:uncharacterized protein YjiS (DUF1127 family)
MRKIDEYLIPIGTIQTSNDQQEPLFLMAGQLLAPAPMPMRTSGFPALRDAVRNWLAQRRSRQALLEMSDEQLLDIGITRRAARREAARSRFLA